MSIKNDRWIRRMARESGMIEPFEENQVRRGAISYGVSSYGYDMRVADEFRIFHNAFSTLVDPKNFDERSFLEYSGESCIIPPNSFALARSVEYFRIPRSVLTICLGKSTYARCFHGGTRVALVDGSSLTLEEMAERSENGARFWGYSLGTFGRIIVTLLEAPRFVGRDSLIEITLDNGRAIRCTPDHEFVRRDGRLAPADDLRPGDSLMPLYRELVRGYEAVYQPLNGRVHPTHRLADEWNLRNGVYDDTPGTHRHHRDHDRSNNAPWNIIRTPVREHVRRPGAHTFGDGFARSEPVRRFRHPVRCAAVRRDLREQRLASRTPERQDRQRNVRQALERAGSIRGAERRLGCERPVFGRFPEVRTDRRRRNHRIETIRALPGDHDVYCVTVPEAGNFALSAGVFVRNCGIITNVTPFEPEWEGYVTLEISNTTPLPARIYANEGIAQVIFFEADEECEVSYADKKGKYQKQKGVTPPRL